jgi:hypothetical protein
MKITIFCQQDKIEIVLYNGKKVIDRVEFLEMREMSQQLLKAIDLLIKKNGFKKTDITNISVRGTMEKIYTSRRIAEITAKTFNYAISPKA